MRYLIHRLMQALSFQRCNCPEQQSPHSHHLTRIGEARFIGKAAQ